MNQFKWTLVLLVSLVCSSTIAWGADSWNEFPLKHALASDLGKEKLDGGIKFFLKGQKHPAESKSFGVFKSNQRSRKFGRTAEDACDTALISALMRFQDRALREGGDAVVDIYSITKNQKFESPQDYRCLTGGMSANVALKGRVVKLK